RASYGASWPWLGSTSLQWLLPQIGFCVPVVSFSGSLDIEAPAATTFPRMASNRARMRLIFARDSDGLTRIGTSHVCPSSRTCGMHGTRSHTTHHFGGHSCDATGSPSGVFVIAFPLGRAG